MKTMTVLKNHPFPVVSHFDCSLVLTYAVPREQLEHLIPSCLSLDVYQDKWAFVAVAMVKTRDLRPKGFPRFFGRDFILAGYRIFVRYNTSEGKRLRGLYILRSETNKASMALLGNIFTHYNYQQTDISFTKAGKGIHVCSEKSNLRVTVEEKDDEVSLPKTSPFSSWKEARRYAGPLPFTFTYQTNEEKVLIIEGVRNGWTPKPVEVIQSEIGFIERLRLKDAVLANAFVINDIPYYWKKGKTDVWKQ